MSKYQIRKEIAELIDSIKQHSDNIGDIRYIPQLELESILHKIEKLYEKSIVFNYLNSLPEETELEKPAETIVETPIVVVPEPIVMEQKEEVVIVKEEIKPPPETPKPIAKPVSKDIKTLIGINDKFQFTNELFQKNAQEYSNTIEQLNNSESWESVLENLKSYQSKYNWDVENSVVKRFFDLVKRKFS